MSRPHAHHDISNHSARLLPEIRSPAPGRSLAMDARLAPWKICHPENLCVCRFAGAVSSKQQRRLRSMPAAVLPAPAPMTAPMTLAVVTPKTDPQLATLFSLAESLGYDLTLTSKNRREIALSILNRLRPRTGTNVYQSAAFSLFNIPRETMEKILPKD